MPTAQWNIEFLNHNSQRAYPITADSTAKDTTQSFQIPTDFLVGMDVAIHPTSNMSTGRFLIRQLGLYSSGIQLTIAYDENGNLIDVATASIPRTSARNSTYTIGGVSGFDYVTGKVVVGRLDSIYTQPAGLFTFDLAGARLEPQVIRPMIRGVTAMRVSSASGSTSENYYGIIDFVAGTNVQLSTVTSGGVSKIIISALEGSGTIEECVCEGTSASLPCIKTINGVPADSQGNFNLVGDNCIELTPTGAGLKITDSCCQPCCGCDELEAITRDLEKFNQQRVTYEVYVDQLAAEVGRMRTSTLGSRLSDRRCLDCG
jgi:hypothetical protein